MKYFPDIEPIVEKGFSYKIVPNNIYFLKYDDGVKIDKELMTKVIDSVLESYKNEKFRSIVDFSNNSGKMTDDAKELVTNHKELNNNKICEALITNSFSISLLIGMYIRIFKPSMPTKTFSKFESAKKWVMSFSLENNKNEAIAV